MAVVKLRERDKKKLDKLTLTIKMLRGKASKSEVLGFSLSFAENNLNEFISAAFPDLEKESIVQVIKNPVSGERTDARRVKEYLYT
ncbi:MAG: hypothetical protein ACREBQ_02050 [Nitrososphaerales archaeon]